MEDYSAPLHVSFGFLGMSSWVLVSGIYSAAGAYANDLPEGYEISVYLTFAQAVSNIVPAVLQLLISLDNPDIIVKYILANLVAGFAVVLLLFFFWDKTLEVLDGDHSIALFILMFLSGSINAASNITHYAFVALFEDRCTLYYGAGLGFGSTFIGILSLLQSRGLMSVHTYFLLFLPVYFLSFYGLWSIHRHRSQKLKRSPSFFNPLIDNDSYSASAHGSSDRAELIEPVDIAVAVARQSACCCVASSSLSAYEIENPIEMHQLKIILCKIFFLSSLCYAILPSTISIVASRFDDSFLVLSLASTISSIIDPLLKLLAGIPSMRKLKVSNAI